MKVLNIPLSDMAPFRIPSVLKGEAPWMSLAADNQIIGKIWVKDGVVSFDGNADESAKVFFSALKACFEAEFLDHLKAAEAERNALAARLADLEEPVNARLIETLKNVAEWINGLPIPTKGATAKLKRIDEAISAAGPSGPVRLPSIDLATEFHCSPTDQAGFLAIQDAVLRANGLTPPAKGD